MKVSGTDRMKGKVFCFASPKGGSGKTIISIMLGKALAHFGKKVLLIDADGSTNGMTLFYLDQVVEARDARREAPDAAGVFDTVDGELTTVELRPGLSLLPATFVMRETHEVAADEFRKNLQTAISCYRKEFDFILIDAQAGIEDFAIAAIEVADQMVIVSEYDPISKKGIARFRKLIASTDSSPVILFNKVLSEFMGSIGDPLGVSDLLPPIPWNADVVRAYIRGELALDMEKGNVFTLGVLRTASALFGKEVLQLVEKWKDSKDEFIRAPIRTQLDEIESELESTQRLRVSAEYNADRIDAAAAWYRVAIPSVMTGSVALTVGMIYLLKSIDTTFSSLEGFMLGSFPALIGAVIIVLMTTRWLPTSRGERKLKFLQQSAIYSDQVEKLRKTREELLSYEKSPLEKLLEHG